MDIIGKNAKLGDGCLHIATSAVNARALFNGKNVQWVTFKRDLAQKLGYKVTPIKATYSGYKDDWSLVGFSTAVDGRLTEATYTSRSDVIRQLSRLDLILWYLDDGSWHKAHNTMHLYCNSLESDEVEVLCDRIELFYGVRPAVRIDRKKDGRQYPYLYFPRTLVIKFQRDVTRFLKWCGIDSMLYKVGIRKEVMS